MINFTGGNYFIEIDLVFFLQFLHVLFDFYIHQQQFAKIVNTITGNPHWYFLQKAGDVAFLFIWIPVIKKTNLHWVVDKFLDKILNRNFSMVFFQLTFIFNFPE